MNYIFFALALISAPYAICDTSIAHEEVIVSKDIDVKGNVAEENYRQENVDESRSYVDRELENLDELIEKKNEEKIGLKKMRKKLPLAKRILKEAIIEKNHWNTEVEELNELAKCEENSSGELCQKLLSDENDLDQGEITKKNEDQVRRRMSARSRNQNENALHENISTIESEYTSSFNSKEYLQKISYEINTYKIHDLEPCHRQLREQLRGKLQTQIKLNGEGRVDHIALVNPGFIPTLKTQRCISTIMSGWRFPASNLASFKFDFDILYNPES